MSITEVRAGDAPAAVIDSRRVTSRSVEQPRDLQRTFQLVLATVWLLDAVLQLQPFMFTRGSNGFSGMLNTVAAGNPGWVAHSITWNASNVYHNPVLSNSVFALVQFLIGFGIVWKRSLKPALVALHRLVAGCLVVRGRSRKHPSRWGHPLRRRPRWRALLRRPGGPAVAQRGLGPTVRRCSERRGERREGDLGGGLGPAGSLGGRRLGSIASGAARPGGRLHRTARLACPHRSGHRIDVPPSRHDGCNPPRRDLCGRGGRGLPSSAVHQGRAGPRDR